jgi:hypothetical protein
MPATVGNAADTLRICAVLGRASEPVEAAVAQQTRRPDVVVADPPSLRTGLMHALEEGADWVWVLDRALVPRSDALGELIDALDRVTGPHRPDVLAGVVRELDGGIERSRAFWFRSDDVEPAMSAVAHRLLPIRATAGPVLVDGTAATATPPAAADRLTPAATFSWTAMLLRYGAGYLVPGSEYDAVERARDPLGDPRTAARLILGGAFGPLDRVRVGYELAGHIGPRLGRRRSTTA